MDFAENLSILTPKHARIASEAEMKLNTQMEFMYTNKDARAIICFKTIKITAKCTTP